MSTGPVVRAQRAADVTVVLCAITALYCLARGYRAGFGGAASGLPPIADFLVGMGLAMAPSAWWLALLVGLRRWAARPNRTGRIALAALALLLAFGNVVGQVGEPFAWRALDEGHVLHLVMIGALVGVPAVAAVLAWRALQAGRAPARLLRRVMRIAGDAALAVVWLVALAVAGAYGRTEQWLARPWPLQTAAVTIPMDAATIARGEHLGRSVAACPSCHGDDLGGKKTDDIPLFVTVNAPNITPGRGSVVKGFTPADWVRMLRRGVKPDGRSARIMPIEGTARLSDEDLVALVAWLRSLRPVDRTMAPPVVGPLGRVVWALGVAPIGSAQAVQDVGPAPPAVRRGRTEAYGRYLVEAGGCAGCHGTSLRGGPIPGAPPSIPPATDLTPSGPLGRWTEADFVRTMRTGVDPTGHHVAAFMPWRSLTVLDDDELGAIWLRLRGPVATARAGR